MTIIQEEGAVEGIILAGDAGVMDPLAVSK